ncbi:MAG: hypothetical protein RLZZ324_1317 [Candidatus Parcubacteria bacterium]|jgi:hypothetical protein
MAFPEPVSLNVPVTVPLTGKVLSVIPPPQGSALMLVEMEVANRWGEVLVCKTRLDTGKRIFLDIHFPNNPDAEAMLRLLAPHVCDMLHSEFDAC